MATTAKTRITKTAVLGAFRAAFGQVRSDWTLVVNLLCALDSYLQYRAHANPRTRQYGEDNWNKARGIARAWGAKLEKAPDEAQGFRISRDGMGAVDIPLIWLDWIMDRK